MEIDLMKKKCNRCKESKGLRYFYRDLQKKDGLQPYCKKCERKRTLEKITEDRIIRSRIRGREHYRKNSESIRIASRAAYKSRMIKLLEYMGNGCTRCGELDKRVLQIDHINGGGGRERKTTDVTKNLYKIMIKGGKIDGYQILCANCNLIEGIEKGYKKSIWI